MNRDISYVIVGDTSKKSSFGPPFRIIYVTPGIKDGSGYEVEECMNRSTFEFIHELDIENALLAYQELRHKQAIATVFYARTRLKNGQTAFLECTISFCYKWVVGTSRILDSIDVVDFWSRNALSEAIYLIDEDGVTTIEERMVYKRNCEFYPGITYQDPFNSKGEEMEMRAAFVLNHYTEQCDVLFCTESVRCLFGLCPSSVVGSSFFQYIHIDDLDDVHAEIDDLKSTGSITKCYFTICSPRGDIDVEMYGVHTSDALAIIVRKDTSFKSFTELL